MAENEKRIASLEGELGSAREQNVALYAKVKV